MIRPKNFGSNPETITNNAFQNSIEDESMRDVQSKVEQEFDLVGLD